MKWVVSRKRRTHEANAMNSLKRCYSNFVGATFLSGQQNSGNPVRNFSNRLFVDTCPACITRMRSLYPLNGRLGLIVSPYWATG